MVIEKIESFVVKLPRPGIAEDMPDYGRPGRGLSYETDPPN